MRRVLAILIWAVIAASFAAAARAQMYAAAGGQQYLVTDIGNLSSQFPYCAPTAINSYAQIAGNSNVSPSDANHGFYYPGNGAALVDIGPTGAGGANIQSQAFGINDSSWIAGALNGEAAVWTARTGLQAVGFLGTGNASVLNAINNLDVAVGGSMTLAGSDSHAAIWTPSGGLQDLNSMIVNPPTGWAPSDAVAISQNGLIAVIGDSITGVYNGGFPVPNQHAFVLNGGTMTTIPDPGVEIYPRSIDNSGEVCGFYFDASEIEHAFVYSAALGTVDIGTLGLSATGGYTPYTEALGISGGTVVGSEGLTDGSEYAFLWTEGGGMVEVEAPTGVVLDGLTGISSDGDLIASGYYSNDTAPGYRGFLLTPTPEPNSILLLAASAATVLIMRFALSRKELPAHRIALPVRKAIVSTFADAFISPGTRPSLRLRPVPGTSRCWRGPASSRAR